MMWRFFHNDKDLSKMDLNNFWYKPNALITTHSSTICILNISTSFQHKKSKKYKNFISLKNIFMCSQKLHKLVRFLLNGLLKSIVIIAGADVAETATNEAIEVIL